MLSDSDRSFDALRVLYLEDDALVAMNFVALLEGEGALVDDHTTIEAALAALHRADYDLALLDVDIRGKLSFPVAEAAVAKGLSLVFVTAYGQESLPPRWQDHAVCEKPCSQAELSAAIQTAITRRESQKRGGNVEDLR
jgi:DNA-binding response OmpR family regulator